MSGTLRVTWREETRDFDYAQGPDGMLEVDEGLETACAASLFTDARATTDELRAAEMPLDDHRGSPFDGLLPPARRIRGSKLWLLARALKSDDTLAQGQQWASEALLWLVEDRVAALVTVRTYWIRNTGFMAVDVEITRPGETEPRWRRVWDAQVGKLLTA